MSIVLTSTMLDYECNIVYGDETTDAPSWRSTALSLISSDELGAQPLFEHSNDHSTCVVEDRQMVDERHIILHYYDGSFLISTSQLNEKAFPSAYLHPYGFNMVIDEWFSLGDL